MRIGIFGALVWLGIVIAGVIGWILNIITIAHTDNLLSTGMGILRVVGIFVPPLGAILGWL